MNVLITGGASGLGLATAEAVEKQGWRPLVVDVRRPDQRFDTPSPIWPTGRRPSGRSPSWPRGPGGWTPWSPPPASTPAGGWPTCPPTTGSG